MCKLSRYLDEKIIKISKKYCKVKRDTDRHVAGIDWFGGDVVCCHVFNEGYAARLWCRQKFSIVKNTNSYK